MSALTAIMDEIADTLDASLAADGWQVVGRLNLNPTPPSIDLYPADPFGDDTLDGFGTPYDGLLAFTLRARVNVLDDDAAQETLLDLMDDESGNSPRVLLEDDQTLNGLASSVQVTRPSGYSVYTDAGGTGALLGCEWTVRVLNHTT